MSADIDECEIGDCICSENAVCINIYRGYECQCVPGFTGDGQNCTGEGFFTIHPLMHVIDTFVRKSCAVN